MVEKQGMYWSPILNSIKMRRMAPVIDITKKLLVFIFIFVIISCKDTRDEEKMVSFKNIIQDNLGNKLILPDDLPIYTPFANTDVDSTRISNYRYMIYTYINTSCTACIDNFNAWNNIAPEFGMNNVPVFIICGSDDGFELIKFLCESGGIKDFPYPFLLDEKNDFLNLNPYMKEHGSFQTVLTNNKHEILMIGNPIYSEEIKKMYLMKLQELEIEN